MKINSDNILLCPYCHDIYLHHGDVEIYERGEDEEKGLHVKVENEAVTIDTNISGNPSSRRHGLTIRFWCEGCHATSILSIAQHKGITIVDLS